MSDIKTFRCPCCDTVGDWQNIDQFRLRPSEMHMCNSCGIVQYPTKYKSDTEIKEYYRTTYRPAPQAANLFTGERKLQYHAYFLSPLFEEWKSAGIEAPVVGEVGAAYGLFLNWLRQHFPNADICGTELTESFRRVAFHEFGLSLQDDLDETKKYDLIASYHVLEHQTNPDEQLKKYASLLKDSGLLYLSVPIWFRDANNSVSVGFDVEYYWATDHINAWSEEHLEWIIAKAGLEYVMKNTDVYGNTYILKKSNKAAVKPEFKKEKYFDSANRIYKMWAALQENQSAIALELWPNCPAAWMAHYELNRANFHKDLKALDQFLNASIEACPNSSDAVTFAADVLTRYERYDEAYEKLSVALKKKPNSTSILMAIANTFRQRALKEKDENKRAEFLKKSINTLRFAMSVSTEVIPQALSWIYHDESLLPYN